MQQVLVVDDEEEVRLGLREVFESEGYGVSVASNGEEALALLERETPMVALIDLLMPVMDGRTLIDHLEAREKRIPILILSAGRSGAHIPLDRPVFIKPLRIDDLVRAVRALDPTPARR